MEIPLRYTRWPAIINVQGNEMKIQPAGFQLKAVLFITTDPDYWKLESVFFAGEMS